ncbi:MAG: 2-deoxy-5-keto-D-gluconate 6-phosphate aldolase domain-containing protein [Acidimicrobiales bacterium]|jgi:myo-inositol catabolism protein IolC
MSGRLFVLAVDHRASFRKWSSLHHDGPVSAAELSDLKLIVADAMVVAAERHSIDAGQMALLCEPEYGAAAIRRVQQAGLRVVVPVEKSGQREFIFEHGDTGYAAAIERSGADAVKALVRYNPSSGGARNARSRERLARLGEYCERYGILFMLELLVPPGRADIDENGDPRPGYDSLVRPGLTVTAIGELRAIGLRPQWWKLEGQPNAPSFAAVAAATGAIEGSTSCLVLGRAASMPQVVKWVKGAAVTEGFSGFAVGRTLWSPPLSGVLRHRSSRERAVAQISERYLSLADNYRLAERRARFS